MKLEYQKSRRGPKAVEMAGLEQDQTEDSLGELKQMIEQKRTQAQGLFKHWVERGKIEGRLSKELLDYVEGLLVLNQIVAQPLVDADTQNEAMEFVRRTFGDPPLILKTSFTDAVDYMITLRNMSLFVRLFPEQRSQLQLTEDYLKQWLNYISAKRPRMRPDIDTVEDTPKVLKYLTMIFPDKRQKLVEYFDQLGYGNRVMWDSIRQWDVSIVQPRMDELTSIRLLHPDWKLEPEDRKKILTALQRYSPTASPGRSRYYYILANAAVLLADRAEIDGSGNIAIEKAGKKVGSPKPLPERPL